MRKHISHICCLQETHLRKKDLHRLKVKGWKKYSKQMDKKKKGRAAVLISDKIDCKTKVIKRDTEGHFIILKRKIHQEDINTVNICAANIRPPKYIRKILGDFKKDVGGNTIIVGDFNTSGQKWKDLTNKVSTRIL